MRINFSIVLMLVFGALSILRADVIITRDDMILNGKILEDRKPDYVVFANNHGEFTIKYNQIKEIYKTESFKDDIEYLQNIGKTVNERDVKNNYESGEKKLKENRQAGVISTDKTVSLILMTGIFYNKTSGELAPVLPYHAGLFFSAEIPVYDISFLETFEIDGIESEVNFLYSSDNDRSIKGIAVSAGPLWKIPIGISDTTFNFTSLLGAGWYSVKNNETEEKLSAVKWSISIHAGPSFNISTIVLSPKIKIDYIHDGASSFAGTGVSLGAGYSF
ncbi:MAG: hypothetical protein CVV49_06535 [Spirochaetae bacterium HGW-Spirochaetae-5]|nr:MAG: hypothetical protein CVV49_06535 [Spirochaetae bacterium HGW-Spirochaetae-5]